MKEAEGIVISAKMNKTVVVRVERLVQHPRFKRYVVQRTKLKARDEKGCKEGDVVRIVSIRPISKEVCWRVTGIVGRRAIPDAPTDGVAG